MNNNLRKVYLFDHTVLKLGSDEKVREFILLNKENVRRDGNMDNLTFTLLKKYDVIKLRTQNFVLVEASGDLYINSLMAKQISRISQDGSALRVISKFLSDFYNVPLKNLFYSVRTVGLGLVLVFATDLYDVEEHDSHTEVVVRISKDDFVDVMCVAQVNGRDMSEFSSCKEQSIRRYSGFDF